MPAEEEKAKERQRKHGGTAPGKKSLSLLVERLPKSAERIAKRASLGKDTIYHAKQVKKASPAEPLQGAEVKGKAKKTDVLRAMREKALTPSVVDKDAAEIGELYHKGRTSLIDGVRYRVECGQRLAAKRSSVPHGAWLSWLEENRRQLGFDRFVAARLIKISSNVASTPHFDEPTAITLSRQIWGNINHRAQGTKRLPGNHLPAPKSPPKCMDCNLV